jgi:hypothetical protein
MSEHHERLNAVKIFMDESGNGHPSLQPIVCAAELGEDADDIEEQIRNLYENLSSRRNLAGNRGFEKFRRTGFHRTDDPREVSGPFLDLMHSIFFKTYVVATDRTSVPGSTEDERIEFRCRGLRPGLVSHRSRPRRGAPMAARAPNRFVAWLGPLGDDSTSAGPEPAIACENIKLQRNTAVALDLALEHVPKF